MKQSGQMNVALRKILKESNARKLWSALPDYSAASSGLMRSTGGTTRLSPSLQITCVSPQAFKAVMTGCMLWPSGVSS
jgi:hypothetical protein